MNNKIINKEDLLENQLNDEHYLQSLLQVLHLNRFLTIEEIENIQLQILNILTETLGYYTRNESSSVRVEVADKIMLSIYYTIGLSLKKEAHIKAQLSTMKQLKIKKIFNDGEEIIKEKVKECESILKHAQETKVKTINYAYVDTLEYGLPLFFKEYDSRFGAHETQGSIDYPLGYDEMKLVGVEYIEDYLKKIDMENKFCSYFKQEDIEALLKGFNVQSHHLLINIFTIVLMNTLGCSLAGKEITKLDISEGDRIYLKDKLETSDDFNKSIYDGTEKIIKSLSIENQNMIEYIKIVVEKLIPYIKISLENDRLEMIFLSLDKSSEDIIEYEDGESLDNSIFKEITEEIRDCEDVEEKIEIIREEFHSLKDLVDVLGADCIFEDEFIEVFKVLDDFEIALLLKEISNEYDYHDYGTESEKEWHEKLHQYLDMMDSKRKEEIMKLSKGVNV
ncbi:DUF6179 domain-containing protein [Clostridium intestinale]|uniref:Uncharacterized protein n=1 Tax=Clostridium intestinale TaxID=36845 RepID=A0A7D7A5S7_9CLOT|nr:DUF6179 domain-containing protein [Clostridium intestinale]QLY81380.1 hypothetical protein HZF06_07305 [Clostridium intestinale]